MPPKKAPAPKGPAPEKKGPKTQQQEKASGAAKEARSAPKGAASGSGAAAANALKQKTETPRPTKPQTEEPAAKGPKAQRQEKAIAQPPKKLLEMFGEVASYGAQVQSINHFFKMDQILSAQRDFGWEPKMKGPFPWRHPKYPATLSPKEQEELEQKEIPWPCTDEVLFNLEEKFKPIHGVLMSTVVPYVMKQKYNGIVSTYYHSLSPTGIADADVRGREKEGGEAWKLGYAKVSGVKYADTISKIAYVDNADGSQTMQMMSGPSKEKVFNPNEKSWLNVIRIAVMGAQAKKTPTGMDKDMQQVYNEMFKAKEKELQKSLKHADLGCNEGQTYLDIYLSHPFLWSFAWMAAFVSIFTTPAPWHIHVVLDGRVNGQSITAVRISVAQVTEISYIRTLFGAGPDGKMILKEAEKNGKSIHDYIKLHVHFPLPDLRGNVKWEPKRIFDGPEGLRMLDLALEKANKRASNITKNYDPKGIHMEWR